ncbi:MAG: ABC transporter permease [Eubacteriales bacterium]|nr:ABC transporter permease [Eubacteriales bacterium]
MNRFSINTIALGNLRQHKRTYLSMTVGIVLALFFSASLLLFWNSMQISIQEIHTKRYGTQDVIYVNCKDAPFDELAGKGYFSAIGKASILEYISLEGPEANTGFSAAVFDDTALGLIDWEIDGRLPEKAGEIAIEQSALSRLRLDAVVGDMITVSAYIPTGNKDTAVGTGGFLDEPVEKNYTLVGILSDRMNNLAYEGGVDAVYYDYPAAVLSREEEVSLGGKPVINYYAKYSVKYWAAYNIPGEHCSHYQISLALNDYDVGGLDTYNDEDLTGSLDLNNMKTFANSIMTVAFALILASCLGIVNAFSANLRERQRQIGLLRAVAATKRQIRQIFGREAMLIALLSIPPAVLLSCIAVWGIMQLMGPGFHFVLNIWIVLGTAVVGLFCIMAAAFFPLWKVSRIPPMQAIRDVSLSRKLKNRKIRSKKVFDVAKHLAKRSLSLNRRNQLSVIALMTAGMFILTSMIYDETIRFDLLFSLNDKPYSCDYSLRSDNWNDVDAGLIYSGYSSGMMEQDIKDIMALQSVQSAQCTKEVITNIIPDHINKNYLTDFGYDTIAFSEYLNAGLPMVDKAGQEFYQRTQEQYRKTMQKYDYTQEYYTSCITALDEAQIEALSDQLYEGEIHLDKLASGEEILVYAPAYTGVYYMSQNDLCGDDYSSADANLAKQQCTQYLAENDMFHAGDTITLSKLYTTATKIDASNDSDEVVLPDDVQRKDRKVTIGGVIDKGDFSDARGTIITNIAGLSSLGYDAKYKTAEVFLSESPTKQMEWYLDDSLQAIAARSGNTTVENYIAMARESRNIAYGKMVAGLAVFILLFAICTCMISNSFATQIQAGKRYIGTLRATGASEHDIWHNYQYQMIYLFFHGAIFGIPFVFAALTGRTLFRKYINGWDEWKVLGFPPVLPALVFLLLMFFVCYCTTRRKVKQVLKGSIVQNIREL